MEHKSMQQEILLVIDCRQADLTLSQLDEESRSLTRMEQMEVACWHGMLEKMVPEILLPLQEGKRFFMVQVQKARNSLYIDLCEEPLPPRKEFSIDPYFFGEFLKEN